MRNIGSTNVLQKVQKFTIGTACKQEFGEMILNFLKRFRYSLVYFVH